MNIFVISLKSAYDRRSHILKEFEDQKLPFSFFDAIEPSELKKYSAILSGKSRKILTDNEISCLLSHVLLWKKAVRENLNYVAIFEDDIYLSKDSNYFLSNVNWIDKSIDIIKIEKVNRYVLSKNKSFDLNYDDYKIFPLSDTHLGAGGYILSNKGAQCLVDYFERLNELDHVDQIIFKNYLNIRELKVFQMNPVLCIQDCILNPDNQKFQSTLHWREVANFEKFTLLEKFLREIHRLFRQMKNYFFKVKLNFKI